MKRLIPWLLLILVLALPFIHKLIPDGDDSSDISSTDKPIQITWRDLLSLNVQTGMSPDWLKELHGKVVKIAGFVVPLEDGQTSVQEFLLVPNGMACIHVPPPPPNQIVHVKLQKPVPAYELMRPIWMIGKLMIQKIESKYGAASYEMLGLKVQSF